MVKLYGVIHGGHIFSFDGLRHMSLKPSHEFLVDLSRFPKCTKVGIEVLAEEDWKIEKTNIYKRSNFFTKHQKPNSDKIVR
jgi:hypothetical protein